MIPGFRVYETAVGPDLSRPPPIYRPHQNRLPTNDSYPLAFIHAALCDWAALSSNAPDQAFQRVRLRLAKIDPGHAPEKDGKLWGLLAIREDHGDNRTVSLHKLPQEGF